MILPFPAAFNLVVIAQLKSVFESSDTAAAAPASSPPIVPAFGAASEIVKTKGSGMGGAPSTRREGVVVEFRGKTT